jgi:hypothetical protein
MRQRPKTTVESLEQRVDIGKDHHDACGVIPVVNEEHELGVPDVTEETGHLRYFPGGHRDKPPVLGP